LNEGSLQAAKKTLSRQSRVRADVSNLPDLDTLFATIKREFGHLDGVFVNAGYRRVPVVRRGDRAKARHKVIAVNFKGAYFTIQKPCRYSGKARL